jgi:cytochrome c oxidase subunit 3
MWFGLLGVTMLFAGLTSAYIVREGLGPDWQSIRLPKILFINTAVLLLSSLTLEMARRSRGMMWLLATLGLGCAFLAGQLAAWGQLSSLGLYLSTNPHASFLYTLTGLHGLHVLGGLVALGYCFVLVSRRSYAIARGGGVSNSSAAVRWMDVTAIYWHFMGGLWIYLLFVLSN